jgi:phage-related protein
MRELPRPVKPLRWVASSRKDYRDFPEGVKDTFGFELFLAQTGQHPPSAKPLKGFASGTIELIENHDGDTYRAIYTVRFETALYVLHCFKKKSKQGRSTPLTDLDLIRKRLKDAEADYINENQGKRPR